MEPIWPYRAMAWYSSFGRMSIAAATRFDMLKNAAVEAMSQMSRSEKPASRSAARSASTILAGSSVSLTANSSIAFCLGERSAARKFITIISPKRRVAGKLAHRRAMGGQAIVAMVDRGDGDRDHLALQLRQAGLAQHQIIVHVGEGAQLLLVEGVGCAAHSERGRASPRIWRNRPCVASLSSAGSRSSAVILPVMAASSSFIRDLRRFPTFRRKPSNLCRQIPVICYHSRKSM